MAFQVTDLRRATQLCAFLWSNSFWRVLVTGRIYKGPFKGTCIPFLNCQACPVAAFSCPIGALQHYVAIHHFPYFIIGQLGMLGMLVGRMACGWLCPFGLLQDLLFVAKQGGVHLARALGYLRWPVLVFLAVLLPWTSSEDWFCKLCPSGILTAEVPWAIWNPTDPVTGQPLTPHALWSWELLVNIGILALVVGLALFIKRPFCRMVCPLGLIFSFFNKLSLLRLEVSSACDRCDACHRACPMDIKVYEDPNSSECIRCLSCTRCSHVKPVLRLPFESGSPALNAHSAAPAGEAPGPRESEGSTPDDGVTGCRAS